MAGNELIYGIVLGAWLLLTGLGSWLGMTAGRLRRGLDVFLVAQVLVAVLPAVGVFLLRTLRNVVFLRGAALGVTETVIVCVVCLAPYCLLIGYLLALASALVPAGKEARGIGRVYFLDCVGGVVAGLVVQFRAGDLAEPFPDPLRGCRSEPRLRRVGGLAIRSSMHRGRRKS